MKKAQGSERERINMLLLEARSGEQSAFSELLDAYTPLINSMVQKFYDDGSGVLNKDDLRQEAILNFYNSILNFDTEQSEVEFGLYSKICISNALISQLRLHKKHTAEQLSASLNNMFFVHDSEDPSERILEEERVQALHSLISKNLSKYEYRIWQLYMSGRTAKEIGDTVGKSEKSIENAIYRTRKKLRSILN